jgi:hypothetical protein
LENTAGPSRENEDNQQVKTSTAKNKTFMSPQKKREGKGELNTTTSLWKLQLRS